MTWYIYKPGILFLFIERQNYPSSSSRTTTSQTQVSLCFIPSTPTHSLQTSCHLPTNAMTNKVASYHLFFSPTTSSSCPPSSMAFLPTSMKKIHDRPAYTAYQLCSALTFLPIIFPAMSLYT